MSKQRLIDYLETVGKGEHTWSELAAMFNIRNNKTNKLDGKAANDIWRRHKSRDEQPVKATFNVEGMKLKKVWGKPNNLSYSYEVDNSAQIENLREEMIKEISKYSPKVKKFPKQNLDNPVAYEISLPDFHIGRIPVKQAVTLYKATVSKLVERAKHFNIERIILPIGNDFFNSDSLSYTTTKGTPQFDVDEWRVTFRAGWRLIADVITYLSNIAPVYVINIPGNHDRQRAFYLGDMIYAWFRNDENVVVNNSLDVFKFHQYGTNLIMYEHGELKSQDYPLIMATENPTAFADSKYREVHVGHLHKEMLNEYRGVKVRFLPSIAPESYWEKASGYKHIKCAQGLVWDRNEGLITITQVNA